MKSEKRYEHLSEDEVEEPSLGEDGGELNRIPEERKHHSQS